MENYFSLNNRNHGHSCYEHTWPLNCLNMGIYNTVGIYNAELLGKLRKGNSGMSTTPGSLTVPPQVL